MHTPVIPTHRHGIEGGSISLQSPDLNRPSMCSYLRNAGLAFLVCLALAWMLTGRHVDRKAEQTMAEADRKLQQDMTEIATGLQRNLNVYHGIPASIGRDETIRRLLATFPPEVRPSTLPHAERRAIWSQDPALAALSRSLAKHVQDIPAFSVLWVANAAGDTIAASNVSAAESFVGTNYADREYFLAARQGRLGRQFAVGRRTNIPGLFFSAPVLAGERFLGAVVAKIDLPYLVSWVNQKNAFITDRYGVIILAQDKSLEMQALPSATVGQLSPAQRSARYKKENIPELSVAPWDRLRYPSLRRLDNDDAPLLMASHQIPEEDLTVAVNLSAIQFRKPGLVQSVERALSSSGLPAGHLELELTESAVMGDTERALQTLQSLKTLGVHLAIDDFGAGYSSLAYLKIFAPDVLKIDRSFIRDIETDENDLAIIRAIINLGQSLGYRVIAEGVETESQLHRLAGLGCDEIQGYWYSRPLAADVCTDFLRAQQVSS